MKLAKLMYSKLRNKLVTAIIYITSTTVFSESLSTLPVIPSSKSILYVQSYLFTEIYGSGIAEQLAGKQQVDSVYLRANLNHSRTVLSDYKPPFSISLSSAYSSPTVIRSSPVPTPVVAPVIAVGTDAVISLQTGAVTEYTTGQGSSAYTTVRTIDFTYDALNTANIRIDLLLGISKVMPFLQRNGIYPDTMYVIYDSTTTDLAMAIKQQLQHMNMAAQYKIELNSIDTEQELKAKLGTFTGKNSVFINLVTMVLHEESGTYLTYNEIVNLAQRWNRKHILDIGLHPTNSICLCVSSVKLVEAILATTSNLTLIPDIRLNVPALEQAKSRLYIDALDDLDSIEVR